MDPEQPLAGGNLSSVVRVGDSVRRTIGPWTPAVHRLLQHLEAVGFPYSPRVLGFDELGREVLTYIEGETLMSGSTSPWIWTDEGLVQAALVLREYHQAVVGFCPMDGEIWQGIAGSHGDELLCHNDHAPNNVVWRDGQIVGLIDWDLACPGSSEWDLAHALWTFIPIVLPRPGARGDPTDVPRRIRLMCDSYGLENRSGLLRLVLERMWSSIRGIETKADLGEPAYESLVVRGDTRRMKEDAGYLVAQLNGWQAALSSN